MKIIFETINLL